MSLDDATVEQLRKLKALADDGIITPEEFTAKKAQILHLDAPRAPPGKAASKAAPAATQGAAPACDGSKLVLEDSARGTMVTGATLKYKGHIKGLGGRWDPALKAWFVEGSTVDLEAKLASKGIPLTVVALPEGGAEADDAAARREQELVAAKDEVIARAASAHAGAHLQLRRHKRAVLVQGETSKVRDLLQALGGKYIPSLGGYCLPGKSRTQLVEALWADDTNVVTEEVGRDDDGGRGRASRRRTADAEDDFVVTDDSE